MHKKPQISQDIMIVFCTKQLPVPFSKANCEVIKLTIFGTGFPVMSGFNLNKLLLIVTILLLTSCNVKYNKTAPSEENVSHKLYYQDKIQAEFTAKEADNEFNGKIYYLDGNLSSTCAYINGLKNGIENKYYPDGKLYRTREYSNGEMNGIEKRFYKNGRLKTILHFKSGMPGKGLKEYDASGNLKSPYPDFLYKVVYDRDYERQKLLLFYFSDHRKNVYYYKGSLIEGKYFDTKAVPCGNRDGVGEIAFYPDFSGEVIISAKYITHNRAPYIVQKTIYVE
ncbi:MAG TPA: hypothetical protein VLA03_01115 [Draconibacterium sp.]|nr:hypothetical protein [Draconibacterium sp.]